EISRVENLEVLPSLTKLNLSCNRLTSHGDALAGVSRLVALTDLDLSGNAIASLCALAAAGPSLARLNLADNDVADTAEARHLAALPALRDLTLSGNPLCGRRGYRAAVLAALPELAVLDGVPIGGAEAIASRVLASGIAAECGSGGKGG
ncbi:unnamed protein product, partial [Phaeothamnion confervicola]